MKKIEIVFVWLITSVTSWPSFHVLTEAAVRLSGVQSHHETRQADERRQSRDTRAVDHIPWSGVRHWNMTLEAAEDGLGRTRSRRPLPCYKRKLPDTCATNMDCSTVRCNLLFSRRKGSVKFKVDANCRRPSLIARVKVRSLGIDWAHTFTSRRRAPVLIPRLSYDMGVMQGGVFLKAKLFRKSRKRLTVNVRLLIGGRIPKVSSYLIGTKLLHLSLRSKGKKCGKRPGSRRRPSGKGMKLKKPSPAQMGFPCQKMNLGKLCKISGDCLKIKCGLSFAGQTVSLSFGINKCDNPISLTATVRVSTLGIKWQHKMKGGSMLAIPGYGVNVGVMKAGVFLKVGLRPKGNKLALMIRLMAGASVPFVGKVYPLKITLLNVKLPIKVKSCGGARYVDTPNLSQIFPSLPSDTQSQSEYSRSDDKMDPREEPFMYGRPQSSEMSHEEEPSYEYQELGAEDPIMPDPSASQSYWTGNKEFLNRSPYGSPVQGPLGGHVGLENEDYEER